MRHIKGGLQRKCFFPVFQGSSEMWNTKGIRKEKGKRGLKCLRGNHLRASAAVALRPCQFLSTAALFKAAENVSPWTELKR